MGKLILCKGKIAENPFRFKLSETNIYTIEELCYFLYHNKYILSQELFDKDLVKWLEDAIDMPEMADKLRAMIDGHNSLTDIVISLLCSCDYYGETEVKEMAEILDSIDQFTVCGRRKMKGDNYLKYGNYAKAAKEYEIILQSSELSELTREEHGAVLHNLAVTYVYIATYHKAAEYFEKAYKISETNESLKQYLFALKLGNHNMEYEKEINNYQLPKEVKKEYDLELHKNLMQSSDQSEYKKAIMNIKNLREYGRIGEYYEEINKIIGKWKQEYRKEVG